MLTAAALLGAGGDYVAGQQSLLNIRPVGLTAAAVREVEEGPPGSPGGGGGGGEVVERISLDSSAHSASGGGGLGGSAIGAAFLAPDDRPPSQASERSEPRRSTGDPVAAAAAASAAAAAASAAASAAAVASAVVAEDEGPTGGAAAAAARAGGGDAFLKRLVTAAGEPIVASTLAFVDTFEPAAAAAGEQAAVDASVHPDALAARAFFARLEAEALAAWGVSEPDEVAALREGLERYVMGLRELLLLAFTPRNSIHTPRILRFTGM